MYWHDQNQGFSTTRDVIHMYVYYYYRDVASRPTVSDLLKHEFINVSATSDGAGIYTVV